MANSCRGWVRRFGAWCPKWSAVGMIALALAASAHTDDVDRQNQRSDVGTIIPLNPLKKWKITMTVGCGGGLEGLRFGWHSVELDSDGKATVLHHHGGEFNTIPPVSSDTTERFRGQVTDELRTAAYRAAAAAVNNFELQPAKGAWSDDGCRVMLKIETNRREVSVKARELGTLRDGGDDFVRFIDVINGAMPSASAIKTM